MHLISDLGQSVQPEFSLQLYRSQKGQNPSYLDHKMRWCRILNFIQKVQLLKISDEFAFRWPWPPGQRSGFLKILWMQYLENKTFEIDTTVVSTRRLRGSIGTPACPLQEYVTQNSLKPHQLQQGRLQYSSVQKSYITTVLHT